jgi:Domain of unknown function (DUF4136)
MIRSIARLVVPTVAVLLAACATNPVQVRVDKDAARDVAGYRTFGFHMQQATDGSGYQTLLTAHLETASRGQLEKHGYVFAEHDPDLLVYFHVNVQKQQEVRATPTGAARLRFGYAGWTGYDVDTVTTRQGAVTIDVVDARSRTVVWQGVGEGVVSRKAEKNVDQAIDKAVAEVFRDFPSRHTR